jgi:type II secretory ATPase GspE/PulE/Tfp pilus assembly ATPase PilB-like protein
MLKEVGITPEQLKGGKVYRGKGCPACSGTGYSGRTGIYEILLVSETIRQLIMKKADSVSIGRQAVEEGMKTLREDGARKIIEGITALEEVLRVTQD